MTTSVIYRDAVGFCLEAENAASPEQTRPRRDRAIREKVLLAHHGAGLIEPQCRECLPQSEFLIWHRAEVFKAPARE